MHGLISQILLSCWSSNRIYWLDEKLVVQFFNLCFSQSPTRQPNQPKIHPRGILQDLRCPHPKLHKIISILHSPPFFWKDENANFNASRKARACLDFTGEAPAGRAVGCVEPQQLWQVLCHLQGLVTPRTCKTPNSYLSLHIFLFNHHLPLCVPFPSAWRSGVGQIAPEPSFPTGGYQEVPWWVFISCVNCVTDHYWLSSQGWQMANKRQTVARCLFVALWWLLDF